MSRFTPLLRALLCFALLLNGTAYAHVATRMAMGDIAAAAEVRNDDPPCHEGMAMKQPAMPGHAFHQEGDDSDASLPDCCKAGNCDGFCTPHAPALNRLALPSAFPAPQAAPAYRMDARASARLSHRHRPPILTA